MTAVNPNPNKMNEQPLFKPNQPKQTRKRIRCPDIEKCIEWREKWLEDKKKNRTTQYQFAMKHGFDPNHFNHLCNKAFLALEAKAEAQKLIAAQTPAPRLVPQELLKEEEPAENGELEQRRMLPNGIVITLTAQFPIGVKFQTIHQTIEAMFGRLQHE